ncbi:hypothetical protein L6452_33369 [Arctium lappa]|uniref:Uncharacterized protein n=1 Tax=Arctium lappa TaxID=4217 RepID=A0ACB8YGF8_ARCLA|nr:hypothetical protein L6452_33369 [Arctium lappa]
MDCFQLHKNQIGWKHQSRAKKRISSFIDQQHNTTVVKKGVAAITTIVANSFQLELSPKTCFHRRRLRKSTSPKSTSLIHPDIHS